ncbi:SGNH hydrolase domain-containing protein [Paractinoplanes toevensis]|uniref:SGNH domain-containing protein n=1 Tax=Paractinoplanes toevensis TaxID=571911 RepID=A0A919W7G9_9ACTN|nr:SGNH hydrolase domain-containing protein [Actinoplanes toevensis]GIM95133.1 hypothetical protein Ato02nite_069260 [Actinoplanes toevensis]
MRRSSRFILLALLAGCTHAPSTAPQPAAPPGSRAAVLSAVRAAADLREVPADLTPSVAAAGDDLGLDYQKCEAAPAADRIGDPCVFGDRTGTTRVVLYGDSHAGMWLPAMTTIAARRHWRLEFYGKPACPAPRLTFWNQQENRPFTACDRFRDFVLSRIGQSHPDLVVVTNESYAQKVGRGELVTPAQWETGLVDTLTTIGRSASRVIVLGDTPVLDRSAPDCLAAHASDIASCFTTSTKATARVWNAADEAAAKETGAGYVSVLPWLCREICTPVIGNILVYRNQFHLTGTYARMLTGVLEDALVRARTAGDGTP